MDYLKNLVDLDFSDFEVAVDAGNGAQSHIAEEVLKSYGAKVKIINNEPNGMNINDSCGSTNPNLIQELVKKKREPILVCPLMGMQTGLLPLMKKAIL